MVGLIAEALGHHAFILFSHVHCGHGQCSALVLLLLEKSLTLRDRYEIHGICKEKRSAEQLRLTNQTVVNRS
jgi:hypothetical protein